MSAPPAPPPVRTAPIALWRVAEAFLHTLHMLFGAPEDVARAHTLTAKAHGLMAQWLRCAEAMLRRLLAIEAAAYPKPEPHPQRCRTRVRETMSFSPDAPEDWRVSFRCFASLRQAQGAARANESASPVLSKAQRRDEQWMAEWLNKDARPETFCSAWPLAERYEALLRVLHDPAAYARRLARRLHAQPHRLKETLRAPLKPSTASIASPKWANARELGGRLIGGRDETAVGSRVGARVANANASPFRLPTADCRLPLLNPT